MPPPGRRNARPRTAHSVPQSTGIGLGHTQHVVCCGVVWVGLHGASQEHEGLGVECVALRVDDVYAGAHCKARSAVQQESAGDKGSVGRGGVWAFKELDSVSVVNVVYGNRAGGEYQVVGE